MSRENSLALWLSRPGEWLGETSLSARVSFGVLLFIVATSMLVAALLVDHERTRYLGESGSQLALHAQFSGRELAQEIEILRQDVLFLAHTPPIQGIARAAGNQDFDKIEPSSAETWKQRLEEIFSAFVVARPEYLQLRYIGIAAGGRELVRVDARDGKVTVAPSARLQAKGGRDYFQATMRLGRGEVYLSEVNLNRERGRVEEPHIRTLRAATPVYTDTGERFGLVVINMDAGVFLDHVGDLAPPGAQVYLTNDQGDFLVHPEANRTFGFDRGRPVRWQQEFRALRWRSSAITS